MEQQYPHPQSNEGGLRKRRYAEAQVFGLYDDPENVTLEEARNVYRTLQLHRDEIDRVERQFGVSLDGTQATRNRVAQANRDYPELTAEYGSVPSIVEALGPARSKLLEDVRAQYPELSDRLEINALNAGNIFLAPRRNLNDSNAIELAFPLDNRTQNAIRREQRNSTTETANAEHPAVLDSRQMRGNEEVARSDLLIGDGGSDVLRGHLGDDVLIGGQGSDRLEGGQGHDSYVVEGGDTIFDSDGRGELYWGTQRLAGGTRTEHDPAGTYHSQDGRFVYRWERGSLSITDTRANDDASRQSVIVDDFDNGNLGITLSDSPLAELDTPSYNRDPMYLQIQQAVAALDIQHGRSFDASSERLTASLFGLARENGLRSVDHVVLSRQTSDHPAGHHVFLVQGELTDPSHLRVSMATAIATQTHLEDSLKQVEAAQRSRISQNEHPHLAEQREAPHPRMG